MRTNSNSTLISRAEDALAAAKASDSASQRRRRYKPERGTWWWWGELAAVIAATGCMIAIVGILSAMQEKDQARWTFSASIGATVAAFMTAAKSLCAYAVASALSQSKWLHFRKPHRLGDLDILDDASRGPLGAVTLLMAASRWKVASIGALVTILALGSDTFVQQVVTVEPRDVPVGDGRARFGLMRNYTVGGVFGGGASWSQVLASPGNIAMQGAIYRGIYNVSSPAIFECTSSRCTWEEDTYVSLGFAATCKDVTRATVGKANATLWDYAGGISGANLTTPGGLMVDARYGFTMYQVLASVAASSHLQSGTSTGQGPHDIGATFATVAVLKASINSTDANFQLRLGQLEIVECGLALAAYSYSQVSASGNQLSVGSTTVTPITVPGKRRLAPGGHGADDEITYSQPGLPVFSASMVDLAAITDLLTSPRFSGTVWYGESKPGPQQGVGEAFRRGDTVALMDRMALSMTDEMRSAYQVVAGGLTHVPVVHVRVRWAWLSLPLVVVVASTVYLLVVMDECARSHARVSLWKGSMLAALSYRMSPPLGAEDNGSDVPRVLWTELGGLRQLDDMGKIRAEIG